MAGLTRTPGQSPMLPGAVVTSGLVFTSGLIAPAAFEAMTSGAEVGVREQIDGALSVLRSTLEAADTDVTAVIKLTAYLSSAEYFPDWNAAFLEIWPEPGPARTTVVVGFTSPAILFELEAVAAR